MFIFGADVSTAEEVEKLGGKFYVRGTEKELFNVLSEYGINAIRLRLWNDPKNERGESYGAGGCDLNCVLRLAKRAKSKGMRLLLDFHYSDFWVDPARQNPPKAWKNFSLDQLCDSVFRYTLDTLNTFAAEGVYPEAVQVGNEITNGMLWECGKVYKTKGTKGEYDALAKLLSAGCKGVQESGNAEIYLHLERSCDNALYREWLENICFRKVPFDVLGVSYYPFWHGSLAALKQNLEDIVLRYQKPVEVVETAYPFTSEAYGTDAPLVVSDRLPIPAGGSLPYPTTKKGQAEFLRALTKILFSLPDGKGRGIWYWEPAWLPVKGSSWATRAGMEYLQEEWKKEGNEWANQCLFDYDGNALPAFSVFKNLKEEGEVKI